MMTFRPDPEGSREPPRDEPAQITGFETRQEMISMALKLMDMRGKGQFADLAANLTDDCEMVFPGAPGQSPFNGTFHGRDACIAAMKANYTLIEFIDLKAVSIVAEGDTVVVNWTCGMRNRGTGPMIPVEGMGRLRFRHRKMCYYGNHLDTAALAALAGYPPLQQT